MPSLRELERLNVRYRAAAPHHDVKSMNPACSAYFRRLRRVRCPASRSFCQQRADRSTSRAIKPQRDKLPGELVGQRELELHRRHAGPEVDIGILDPIAGEVIAKSSVAIPFGSIRGVETDAKD